MLNKWPIWKRLVLGVIGFLATVVVGAIGSGVWQRLGDPLYIWLRDASLNLGTLGLAALKDALYAQVAMGLHERPASHLLGLALYSWWYGLFVLTMVLTLLVRMRTAKFDESDSDKEDTRTGRRWRRRRRLLYVAWPATVLIGVLFTFDATRTMYTSRAIGHYRQLVALVGPHVSESALQTYESRFAQIRSAQDYTDLTDELLKIGTDNGLILPEFEPW